MDRGGPDPVVPRPSHVQPRLNRTDEGQRGAAHPFPFPRCSTHFKSAEYRYMHARGSLSSDGVFLYGVKPKTKICHPHCIYERSEDTVHYINKLIH
jgi:hypothetical protein